MCVHTCMYDFIADLSVHKITGNISKLEPCALLLGSWGSSVYKDAGGELVTCSRSPPIVRFTVSLHVWAAASIQSWRTRI